MPVGETPSDEAPSDSAPSGEEPSDGSETAPPDTPKPPSGPERLLIAPIIRTAEGDRCLLLRWPDWPHPALLPAATPGPHETLNDAVATAVRARLGMDCEGGPVASEVRIPARLADPRTGGQGPGFLRPVVAVVRGDPVPDALLEGVETLPIDEALRVLPTEIERAVLREALRLLDDQIPPANGGEAPA